jgi:hypothetical protein
VKHQQPQHVPKIIIHTQLASDKSSKAPLRIVEAMMVDKRSNPYAEPRGRNLQRLPQGHKELERLALKEGVQTRRSMRAKAMLALDDDVTRSDQSHNSPHTMPVMMAGETNQTPEQELEGLRLRMREHDHLIAERDRQIAQLVARLDTLAGTMHQNGNITNAPSPQLGTNGVANSDAAGRTSPQPTSGPGESSNTITPDMLQRTIENILNTKFGGLGAYASPSSNYVKPYPAWHDDIPFPVGYHQPKFGVFDGT